MIRDQQNRPGRDRWTRKPNPVIDVGGEASQRREEREKPHSQAAISEKREATGTNRQVQTGGRQPKPNPSTCFLLLASRFSLAPQRSGPGP